MRYQDLTRGQQLEVNRILKKTGYTSADSGKLDYFIKLGKLVIRDTNLLNNLFKAGETGSITIRLLGSLITVTLLLSFVISAYF